MLRFKIKSITITDEKYDRLPLGRQMDYDQSLKTFKDLARVGYLGTKRKSVKKALSEFIKLNQVTEYYFIDNNTDNYWDDSIQIWYK
jgi:hypothetical protein